MKAFDVAVLGLGAIGSAAVYQFARRKVRVLGIDRYSPPHAHGSTHGATRITREAVGEGEHLTPLARRSHQLWREIEQRSGDSLLSAIGMLVISSPARTSFTHVDNFLATTVAAARRYGIAHEILPASDIRSRYPQFRLRDDEVGYFEPGAGFVRPEACVSAQLRLAESDGAEIHRDERVTGLFPRANEVVIESERDAYSAGHVVLCTGAWLPEFLESDVARAFRVSRQVLYWFAPGDDSFRPGRFPVFIWELSGRTQSIYGFPDIDGEGVKVATEQYDSLTTPDTVKRNVSRDEAAAMHENLVAPFLPQLPADCIRAASCLYTVTPDFGFVIDRHPQSERITIASCCSGHGFKHSPAIGEALAELALTGRSPVDLAPFRLERLLKA